MGYTHYWTQRRDFTVAEWADIRADIEAILKDVQHVQGIPLGNGHGTPGSAPDATAAHVYFNGVGDDSHETFCLDRKRPAKEPWESQRGAGFCKTARKPYDIAVTATLCYLATVVETHSVSSDGDGSDWLDGLASVERRMGRVHR